MNFLTKVIISLVVALLFDQKAALVVAQQNRLLTNEVAHTQRIYRRRLSEEQQAFVQYLTEQGKNYNNSQIEFNVRKQLFLENQQWINVQNEAALQSGNPNAPQYANNQFSDMTVEERKQHLGISSRIEKWIKRINNRRDTKKDDESENPEASESDESEEDYSAALPSTNFNSETATADDALIVSETGLDWRAKGMVNDVKNQGSCGSSWAFAAVAQLESLYAIQNGGTLHKFSEQQLVDCSSDGNDGCNGGFMSYAFDYYTSKNGMISDSDYAYTAQPDSCKASQYDSTGVMSSGRSEIHQDWTAFDFKVALENGPISVGIAANNNYIMNYQSGILDITDCPTKIDMAAVIVGWGQDSETGQEYWIVRFSWGDAWGEGGYIRIAIHESGAGVCQVQSLAVTVNLAE